MLGSQRMALNLASLTPKAKPFTRPQAVEVEVEREALGMKGPRTKGPRDEGAQVGEELGSPTVALRITLIKCPRCVVYDLW